MIFVFYLFLVLGIELESLHLQGSARTTELDPQPWILFVYLIYFVALASELRGFALSYITSSFLFL